MQKWISRAGRGNVPESSVMPESADMTMPELAADLQDIADTWDNPEMAPGVTVRCAGFGLHGRRSMANPEEGEPMRCPAILISSMTKMITATVMKLVEQGDLALDDPISLYLPAELVSRPLCWTANHTATPSRCANCFNHTSGLVTSPTAKTPTATGYLISGSGSEMSRHDLGWIDGAGGAIANAPPVARPGENSTTATTTTSCWA